MRTSYIFSTAFEAFLSGAITWWLLHDALISLGAVVVIGVWSEHYWAEQVNKKDD